MKSKTTLFAVLTLLGAVTFTACTTSEYVVYNVAQLDLSTEQLDFGDVEFEGVRTKSFSISNSGDVSMGISAIELFSEVDAERGTVGAFTISWDPEDLIVPDLQGASTAKAPTGTTTGTTTTSTTTTSTTTTSTETGTTTGTTTTPAEELLLTLPPGATLPISVSFTPVLSGDNFDSVVIYTADGPDEGAVEDRIYRDADNSWRIVYLHGTNDATVGNIVVAPHTTDMGFIWPGQSETAFVSIRNHGDNDIEIIDVAVDEDNCSDGFEVVSIPEPGTILEGEAATVIEMRYEPTEFDEVQCKIELTSTDPDADEIDIVFKANNGDNASNQAPSVIVYSPEGGLRHQGWGDLEMDISVSDPDQPSDTVVCKVRSALQLNANLASCTPTAENGRVTVQVPMTYHEAGLDVLVVQVTDDSEVTRYVSVPVLVNVPYPEDDDDGDGFVVNDPLYPDCDDTNGATYPFAAEVHDGRDNDCDLQIDEGTDGADDDQDGMSEVEGDCNDNAASTYLGAPELQDGADNDCDGTVDEGTSAYDDDDDGFAEVDLDCDDTDPMINPSAPEICGDNIDNNCNGLRDSQEPCVEVDSSPMIVGMVNLNRTSIEEGQTTVASVQVVDADGDIVQHLWESTEGEIDDPTAGTITWSAPEDLPNEYANGNLYRIYYLGSDDDGNQVWAFQEVWVYSRYSLGDTISKVETSASGGCNHAYAVSPLTSSFGALMLPLLILIRRRKA